MNIAEVAGLQNSTISPYFEMYMQDQSGISFEYWADTRSIGLHRHSYCEILIVDRGSCQHLYNGTDTLLIPGDVVVISPHKAHGFSVNGQFSAYNLQFVLQALDADIVQMTEKELFSVSASPSDEEASPVWEKLLAERKDYLRENGSVGTDYTINSLKQGVIHLSPAEYSFILPLLRRCTERTKAEEQRDTLIRKKYLEVILLELCSAFGRQNQPYLMHSKDNQRIMAEVLQYIDIHLADEIDFDGLARKYSFSPNHFRKLFKDMTGLAPTAYINRSRVIQAYDNIQKSGMTLKQAAESVGVYDTNYFSRLFKKVMGCAFSKM